MGSHSFRIGVDIGGTFTDVVLMLANGTTHIAKVVSTSEAYERGILEAVEQLLKTAERLASDCTEVVHGTTVATNAILQRSGARTGLLTTQGFRDVLELRRIRMPEQYNLMWQKPVPLVERYLRREVVERVEASGAVRVPLDRASVEASLGELMAEGIESLAICLIHAYANGAHEQAVAAMVRQLAPQLPLSISSDLLPEMREYERTSTTVVNAYVMPIVQRYLASLERGLQAHGVLAPVLMMQSNGGIMAASVAREKPMHIIESGPAAGVMAALQVASRMGIDNLITMDIGGTTAKASLIEAGAPSYASEYDVGAGISQASRLSKGGGYTLRAPTLDIAEVGAGGGSIVWVDGGGALHVGPQSAGSNPGPACYGQSGEASTLTDAMLLLGYLPETGIAGGAVPLDRERAEQALRGGVASPLGMEVMSLAYGVFQLGVSNMTRAIRSVTTERGKDPRDFTLFAFGGNGGLFAAEMARELDISRVMIPPSSGLFSAFGLLFAEVEHHLVRTMLGRTAELAPALVTQQWQALEAEALEVLQREGYTAQQVDLQYSADLRYVGQNYELRVPWPGSARSTDRAQLARLAEAFEAAHAQTYGHGGVDQQIELVNLRLVATGHAEIPRFPSQLRVVHAARRTDMQSARPAYFGPVHGWLPARVISRADVSATPQPGPIIIEELDATILVPPEVEVSLNQWGCVMMTPTQRDRP